MQELPGNLMFLSRGGVLVKGVSGNIQIGCPPETIKDTMRLPGGVPDLFIIPAAMFDIMKGIAWADIEFPLYYNYFLLHRKTRIVCTKNQARRLNIVLRESFLGPKNLRLRDDYPPHVPEDDLPDLKREMDFFRRNPASPDKGMTLDDVAEMVTFDDQGVATVSGVVIQRVSSRLLRIIEPGVPPVSLTYDMDIPNRKRELSLSHTDFKLPRFGITILGAGHGFNPDSSTSGMIIWINHKGVMVDPPVNSSEQLVELGVNPKHIESVILTHCHSDHDAGTLQKILLEGKVKLYTTPTIFGSFIRKSAALIDMPDKHLQRLVQFAPVRIGEPLLIGGGLFTFEYTLHSIPTVSLQIEFLGKSVVYSSDTLNHPVFIRQLRDRGILKPKRCDRILEFPWHHDVIFHEAGVPPLHTPIEYLCSLPQGVRQRMYLLHTDIEKIPPDSGLKIAPEGLSNTIELEVPHQSFLDTVSILDVIHHVPLFRDLRISQLRELICLAQRRNFRAGEFIHRKDDPIDFFNIVLNGIVNITRDEMQITRFSSSDFFGEQSIILKKNHSATAIAFSDVVLLSIPASLFLHFIHEINIDARIHNMAANQEYEFRALLKSNFIYHSLTPSQKIALHGLIRSNVLDIPTESIVYAEGGRPDCCYLLKKGRIDVIEDGKAVTGLHEGDFVGVNHLFGRTDAAKYTFRVRQQAGLFPVDRNDLMEFISDNPGIYVRMYFYYEILKKESRRSVWDFRGGLTSFAAGSASL